MVRNTIILIMALVLGFNLQAYALPLDGIPEHEYYQVLLEADEKDMEALEQVVYWESARAFKPGEEGSFECSVAVVETILNRALSNDPFFKEGIYEICNQRSQFVCKPFKTTEEYNEMISDAISYVVDNGRTILPSTDYVMFAIKKQTLAKNHKWFGKTKDGKPVKGKGMYFGELK